MKLIIIIYDGGRGAKKEEKKEEEEKKGSPKRALNARRRNVYSCAHRAHAHQRVYSARFGRLSIFDRAINTCEFLQYGGFHNCHWDEGGQAEA